MMRPHRPLHNPTLAAKVARLRELVLTAENLAEPSDYFHDALVCDDAFMALGSRKDEPRLIEIVSKVLETLAPGGRLGKPMVVRIDDYDLCHGCTTWGGGLALFVYFSEADVGFCSYQGNLADPNVWFTRFSVVQSNGWCATPRGSA
jgi:hypothetical protein